MSATNWRAAVAPEKTPPAIVDIERESKTWAQAIRDRKFTAGAVAFSTSTSHAAGIVPSLPLRRHRTGAAASHGPAITGAAERS